MNKLFKYLLLSTFALVFVWTSAFANNDSKQIKKETKKIENTDTKNEKKDKTKQEDTKDYKKEEKNKEWKDDKNEKKEAKLPQEVLDLYKMIETKYWSEKITVDFKDKKLSVPNWSMYFWLAWMKELKDWIKNIDNNIKIDYIMSKLMNFDLWALWDTWSWWLSDWDSLYTYTTYWYYLKTVNTIKSLMALWWDQWSISRVDEYVNKNNTLIKFLLDIWLWSSIWRNESWTSFVWRPWENSKILHESARNWWYYQIYQWCNPIWWNAIEEWTWKRIYVTWKHIWWQVKVYWWSEKYHLKAAPWDKMCASRFWLNIDQVKMTDSRFLELWQKYQQVDKERYNYIKTIMWWNEEKTLIYLWKELQYMHQFYNFVSFMLYKIWNSIWTLTQYSLNWASWWLNKNLWKYWINITNEQYKQDLSLAHKCIFSDNWCSWVPFNWYNNSNKVLFRKVWVQDEIWYRDLILVYSVWVIWTLYNWTKNVWYSYLDNAYVSNPWWMSKMLFWKDIQVNTCRVWKDWWWIECKDWWWSIWVWMSYLFYLKYFLWKEISTSFLEHLSILQNNWQLKYLKLWWI